MDQVWCVGKGLNEKTGSWCLGRTAGGSLWRNKGKTSSPISNGNHTLLIADQLKKEKGKFSLVSQLLQPFRDVLLNENSSFSISLAFLNPRRVHFPPDVQGVKENRTKPSLGLRVSNYFSFLNQCTKNSSVDTVTDVGPQTSHPSTVLSKPWVHNWGGSPSLCQWLPQLHC